MIQCFSKKKFESCFEGCQRPRLLSASKIDFHYAIYPRVLHRHADFLELLYVRTGTGVYIIDGERYDIKKGDIIICNANVLHDEDTSQSKNLNTLSVAVSDINIKKLPKNCLIAANTIPIVHTNGNSISEIMSIIYELLSDIASDMTETCTYLTIALICNVLDIVNEQKEYENNAIKKRGYIIVKQVKSYIDNNFYNDITLKSISKEINVSPYHLAHVFKNSTGYSPIQYVLRRRIGEAQSLLITTKLNITNIALSVGYNNSCHFNSIFSKYIGMSPSRYRNLYVKKK